MLTGIVRWLRGEIRVRAAYRNPARVLNLCAALGVPFRAVDWEDPQSLSFALSRRDWPRLRKAVQTEMPDGTLAVLDRSGLPFLLSRLRRRPALSVALILSAFALFLGSFFIWDFDVEGNRTVPDETILRALERQGVGMGSFGLGLNGQDLRNHVLLDVPELAWMTVNVSGCRARVQVVERIQPPEIVNEARPANITARRAGMVLEVRALDGQARAVRGMTVNEGDLLVSGTEELGTLTGGVRTMAASGSVTARTWHTLTASAPLYGAEKRETGETVTGYSLVWGRRRVPLYRTGRLTDGETRYDKSVERTRWTFLGTALPVTLVRETFRFYERIPAARTEAEVMARTEAALRSALDAETAPYGEVRSALCTARRRGNVLDVTLTAECVEEIGVSMPLAAEDTD